MPPRRPARLGLGHRQLPSHHVSGSVWKRLPRFTHQLAISQEASYADWTLYGQQVAIRSLYLRPS